MLDNIISKTLHKELENKEYNQQLNEVTKLSTRGEREK